MTFTPMTPRPGTAFANGTEEHEWTTTWCGTCTHDRAARKGDYENGCPLILVALGGDTPAEWLDQKRPTPDGTGCEPYTAADQYQCVMYRNEDDGPAEPRPVPDPPNQDALFPRTGIERVRMLTTYPTSVNENA